MSSGRVSEIKQGYLFTHRLSPESSDKIWKIAAGLLAFHIADMPSRPCGDSGLLIVSNKTWITVAGTAPELHREARTGFPFDLLMIPQQKNRDSGTNISGECLITKY